MKLDVRLKRRYYEKLCCEGTSQFNIYFTSSVVVVDLPTDCILTFLFPAETDVLVPVFSQSTDVVAVNFIVVLKFPIVSPPPRPCAILSEFLLAGGLGNIKTALYQ